MTIDYGIMPQQLSHFKKFLSLGHQLTYYFLMQCPECGHRFSDAEILRESAAIQGRKGTGAAKARDPEKMRAAGRLGGLARAKKLKAAAAAKKRKSRGATNLQKTHLSQI
jgi:general stress protein YciG